jgi:enolase
MKITDLHSRWILDSRGLPTVETEVVSEAGSKTRAAVPSGASTGSHEALELRDGDMDHFSGKGVLQAIEHIQKEVAPHILNTELDQRNLDRILCELAGENKTRLGANATLAVSLAFAKTAALDAKQPLHNYISSLSDDAPQSLPMPMFNVINGGKHAPDASDIQEYMIMPLSAGTMQQAVEMGATVFHALKSLLKEQHFSISVGDEGGFAPAISQPEKVLDILVEAITSSGLTPGVDVSLCLDVASSELLRDGTYVLEKAGVTKSSTEMIAWMQQLADAFPIVSIEDGLAEDDWTNWTVMTESLGQRLQLVGDDLLVTNKSLLQKAIDQKSANAILIKPNQIGTLTETIDCIAAAKAAGWNTVVSHRSGETEDVTIAHLAVGTGAGQIKSGSLSRTERTAKYNELMRIADEDTSLSLQNPLKLS